MMLTSKDLHQEVGFWVAGTVASTEGMLAHLAAMSITASLVQDFTSGCPHPACACQFGAPSIAFGTTGFLPLPGCTPGGDHDTYTQQYALQPHLPAWTSTFLMLQTWLRPPQTPRLSFSFSPPPDILQPAGLHFFPLQPGLQQLLLGLFSAGLKPQSASLLTSVLDLTLPVSLQTAAAAAGPSLWMRLVSHHMYPCTLSCLTLPTTVPAAAAAGPNAMLRLPQAVSMDVLKRVATEQKWPPGWAFDGRKNLFTVNQFLDWNMQHDFQVGALFFCCSVLWCSRVCGSLCLGCRQ